MAPWEFGTEEGWIRDALTGAGFTSLALVDVSGLAVTGGFAPSVAAGSREGILVAVERNHENRSDG